KSEPEATKAERAARTLTAGQQILIRRLAARAAAWVRAGRRDDLEGIAAILGCLLRIVILGAGAAGAWWLLRRWPAALWIAVPLWCWAAIRAIPAEDEPEDEQSRATARDDVLALLHTLLGDRDAVHLSEVLKHLQEKGQGKDWKVSDLKARLERLGIPVAPKVKAGGKGPTRGVRKADLPPLSQPGTPEASPAPSTAV
ncbi:hypothetical protein AB0L80_39445, partial [Streptomyces sp. NPDC052069]|uniref:hypothetical protein n=1 Tax=Streptomyces sp. NPDC052069 TaxID=3154650 RepID=UPI00341C1692